MATYQLIHADARAIPLPDESVDCVVTSPPYWGLRDYGVADQIGLEPLHDCLGWADGRPCPADGWWRSERSGGAIYGRCWVCEMLAVFREIKRVLKPWGSAWVNLGDCYRKEDLTCQPWLFVLAMKKDGWIFRRDIVWHKENPMPESAPNRPASAHEFVFMFTKRRSGYFYDKEAVRVAGKPVVRAKKPDGWDSGGGAHGSFHRQGREKGAPAEIRGGHDLRSVWSLPLGKSQEAHFATFPDSLVMPCILAGTSALGNCPACGRPWERVVAREFHPQDDVSPERGVRAAGGQKAMDQSSSWAGFPRGTTHATTTGWRPTCSCDAGDPVPAVVLDPFVGSGTTCRVANRLGRSSIGLDLNHEYLAIAERRCSKPLQPVLAGL